MTETWYEAAGSAISDAATDLYEGAFGEEGYATDAWGYVEQNPEVAKILAGVAGGIGTYYAAKEERKANERFAIDMMERRRKERQIKPGEIENYGTHIGEVNKGLLTNGMIAGGN